MITPIELHNRQHKTGRGYSRKEMDLFLEEVYSNYELLYKENAELKEKLTQLSDGIQYYKAMENTLQKALVLAEQTSKDTIEAATAKAQLIEKEAGLKADTIVNNALSEAEKIKKECISLLKQYNQFKAQYKQIAVKQIELLDGDFYEIYSKDLIDAINDAEVAAEAADTINVSDKMPIGEEVVSEGIPNEKANGKEQETVTEKSSEKATDNVADKDTAIENDKVSDKTVKSKPEQKAVDETDDNLHESTDSEKKIKEGDTKEFAPLTSDDIDKYTKKYINNDDINNNDINHDDIEEDNEDSFNKLFKELREDLAKDVNDSPFEFIDNE